MSFSDHQAAEPVNPYTYFFEVNGRRPFWCWKLRWGNTRLLVHKFEEPTRPGPYYGNPRPHWEVWKRRNPLHSDPFASPVRVAASWDWEPEPYHTDDRTPSFGTFNWLLAPYVEGEPPPRS